MKRCLLSVLVLAAVCFPENENAQLVTDLNCIPITECPLLNGLLKQKPVTSETISIIRTSHCGFEGMVEKVWCPKFNAIPEEVTKSPPPKRSENITERKIVSYLGVSNEIVDTLFPEKCGATLEDKVLGGTATEIDEYPWVALLQYENRRTKKLYNGCGGILINSRYVLTAAHCITTRTKPVRVVLGDYDTRNETDCAVLPSGFKDCAPPPIRLSVESIDVHPKWLVKGIRPFYNDIALIRLAEKVTMSEFVSPICLPSPHYRPTAEQKFTVAGWGRTEKREPAYVKQQVVLPFVDSKECSRTVKRNINEGQMCAGGVSGKDACIGDSGGPLMTLDLNRGFWIAAGVVSLSLKGCGVEGVPGIYTFVPNYLDWIYSKVKP